LLFHDIGFRKTVELSFVIRHGPCSWKRPIILELPGCDLLVKAKEKKRKNEADPSIEPESERRSVWIFAGSEEPEPVKAIRKQRSEARRVRTRRCQITISRSLINAGRCFFRKRIRYLDISCGNERLTTNA